MLLLDCFVVCSIDTQIELSRNGHEIVSCPGGDGVWVIARREIWSPSVFCFPLDSSKYCQPTQFCTEPDGEVLIMGNLFSSSKWPWWNYQTILSARPFMCCDYASVPDCMHIFWIDFENERKERMKKQSLRERPCILSHLCTSGQSLCKVGMLVRSFVLEIISIINTARCSQFWCKKHMEGETFQATFTSFEAYWGPQKT